MKKFYLTLSIIFGLIFLFCLIQVPILNACEIDVFKLRGLIIIFTPIELIIFGFLFALFLSIYLKKMNSLK